MRPMSPSETGSFQSLGDAVIARYPISQAASGNGIGNQPGQGPNAQLLRAASFHQHGRRGPVKVCDELPAVTEPCA